MKIIVVAASVLALMPGAVQAGEGNSEPFPNHASNGQVYANQVLRDTGSESTPSYGSGVTTLTQGDVLPGNGSNSIVQTANSLPQGFEDGTVAYAQGRSVQRWMLAHQERPAVYLAQRRLQ